MDDEAATQDFTGISAPTFTTPNVIENLRLQGHIVQGTPDLLLPRTPPFPPGRRRHAGPVRQDPVEPAPGAVLELRLLPARRRPGHALLGHSPQRPEDRRFPAGPRRTTCARPWPPPWPSAPSSSISPCNCRPTRTRMPIEHDGVEWPERLSPFVSVARLRSRRKPSTRRPSWPSPTTCPTTRGTASPTTAPSATRTGPAGPSTLELSRLRQAMNHTAHIEPTGTEVFPNSVHPL